MRQKKCFMIGEADMIFLSALIMAIPLGKERLFDGYDLYRNLIL